MFTSDMIRFENNPFAITHLAPAPLGAILAKAKSTICTNLSTLERQAGGINEISFPRVVAAGVRDKL
jgi:hypothetical protein